MRTNVKTIFQTISIWFFFFIVYTYMPNTHAKLNMKRISFAVN